MIHIPSEEIKQPQLHADTLGFTFVWNEHFLRGIFPQSVELAKSYFDTGFIEEVVSKGFFPKTWVSEFENEQFGMIIEHEMISPVLFATEWNSAMLKDAALMVLEIAEVGWKHGYNMVDCHKLNVMFKNNHPIYVDLGSFVPREIGCTGWSPYKNFLESYTYILDMWTHGCPQIAKRMMSPGVTFHTEDYWSWKRPLFRRVKALLRLNIRLEFVINAMACSSQEHVNHNIIYKLIKTIITVFKLGKSQKFNLLKKEVNKQNVSFNSSIETNHVIDVDFFKPLKSITCINFSNPTFLGELQKRGVQVISLNESDVVSNYEYHTTKQITSICYLLLNGAVLVRDKYPEMRLQSEAVMVFCPIKGCGQFELHNTIVFLKACMKYSTMSIMYILLSNPNKELVDMLKNDWDVRRISEDNIILEVLG